MTAAAQRGGPRAQGVAALLRQPHRLRGAVRLELLVGIFFGVYFYGFLERSFGHGAAGGDRRKMSLNDMVISPVLQNMAVVALFMAPMLTMRLFAEEKRQGTMELLATSPLTDLQIVLGKFLAAAGLLRGHDPGRPPEPAAALVLRHRQPEWKPARDRRAGPAPPRRRAHRAGPLRLHPHAQPDRGGRDRLLPVRWCSGAGLGRRPHGRGRRRR